MMVSSNIVMLKTEGSYFVLLSIAFPWTVSPVQKYAMSDGFPKA